VLEFISLSELRQIVLEPYYGLFNPKQRWYVPYLITTLAVAIYVFCVEQEREKRAGDKPHDDTPFVKRFLRHMFPKSVYLHRSATLDYAVFYINLLLYGILLAPLFFTMSATSQVVGGFLTELFGPKHPIFEASIAANIAYTLLIGLGFDFMSYVTHVAFHEIPFLWEFHKAHHSGEVMTPVTAFRVHPIDDILPLGAAALVVGTLDATLRHFFFVSTSIISVYDINLILFIYYLFSYNLRHSHIWVDYGPRISKVLISPAQHQIHHSKARTHWNKNYGSVFAIWDWMFGTIYVPKRKEKIEFGINEACEEREYQSLKAFYILPFIKVYQSFRERRAEREGPKT
jgi:sterol desaturase/sphingolipid hydroxylase (fatty acid hydroxylase superfamily)